MRRRRQGSDKSGGGGNRVGRAGLGAGLICINRYLIGQITSDELGPRKVAPGQVWKFGAEIAPA